MKVNTPPPNGTNGTDNWQEYTTRGIQAANISSNRDIEDIKSDIDNYMLIDASIALGKAYTKLNSSQGKFPDIPFLGKNVIYYLRIQICMFSKHLVEKKTFS